MGSIGFTEIMVVLVVALIVLGPARLPEAARSMGKAMRELRQLSAGFEREVKAAFDGSDVPQPNASEAEHGVDPGVLAPGMSYGRPVGTEPPPPRPEDRPGPVASTPPAADLDDR